MHLKLTLALCLLSSSFTFSQVWTKLGTGTNGAVHSLCVFNEGLAIGGEFTSINAFNRINLCVVGETALETYAYFPTYSDEFNERSSSAKEPGTSIKALAGFNNRLHVGGNYFHPDFLAEVSLGYFERDELTSETPFSGYNSQLKAGEQVLCMKSFNNKLFFGGTFSDLNGANGIGYMISEDYPMPIVHAADSGLNGVVHCLEVFNDTLYAGGLFTIADTANTLKANIAKWNGTRWEMVGSGLDSTVFALLSFEGSLYAGGAFTHSDSLELDHIAAWNGSTWSLVGSGFTDSSDVVYALGEYSDTLYAGGYLTSSGNEPLHNLAIWDDGAWLSLGSGTDDTVLCMQAYRGRLYIGGKFQTANALICRNIVAYYNGTESVGLFEPSLANHSATLYPNPASNRISIESSEPIGSVHIYDINGRQALMTATNQADISRLSAGFYTVKIEFLDGTIATEKLIVSKTDMIR